MNRGKLLILLMIAAGVAAGTLKVWKQHKHMDQVLASLSPEVVRLIAEAPQAELHRLRLVLETDESGRKVEAINIDGKLYEIAASKSLIGAKGFVDVRDRLVNDASYNWSEFFERPAPSDWHYLLQFSDGRQHAQVAFDIRGKSAIMMLLGDGPWLSADPIADGLATFFAAQFGESAASAK